ncbi:hypothetical protein MMIC_P2163 [Mariprofundus micogutta]|uniref:Outer membrane protein n=1 Tax=Mariprofundus micogutta TaxID=1921010 RepID=A0A1L8CQL4_9PROT|nr:hypothetical protein [Mariprofundus micogutta]GAV21183.1 hypothetical protein MMIC_P2163 [Mariprofundus micogutta]
MVMNLKKKMMTAVAAGCFAFAGFAQADETVAIKAGYMILSPSGQFGASVNNVGTKIDMNTDLNFDNSTQPTGEISINLGDSLLTIGYVPMSFAGNGVLAAPVVFNGTAFAGAVSSEFNADIIDIGYTYYLVNMDDLPSRFQLGIESSVKTVIAKTSMTGGALTANKDVTLPIPTLGLRGRVALADFIGLVGRVGYLGYAGNSFLDVDAQIEFSPIPTLGIYGGYRQMTLKIDNRGVFADTTFKGPYAGGFFRF